MRVGTFAFVSKHWKDNCSILQTASNYRVYLDICEQMTSELDVITLGTYVQCDEKFTERQINQCRDLKGAAFNILRFADKEYGPQEKWQKIIKAFEALGNNRAIAELSLRERLEERTEVKQAVKGLWRRKNRLFLFCDLTELFEFSFSGHF